MLLDLGHRLECASWINRLLEYHKWESPNANGIAVETTNRQADWITSTACCNCHVVDRLAAWLLKFSDR